MDFPPQIGLGTVDSIYGEFSDKDPILVALRKGYRRFTFTENYRHRARIAIALQTAYRELGISRSELEITLKVSASLDRKHLFSLIKAFDVQYFDLVLIHNPTVGGIFENAQSLQNAWSHFSALDSHLFRKVGVSNFYEPHLERLIAVCEQQSLAVPYANEIEITLLSKNKSLIEFCKNKAVRVIAYTPANSNAALSLYENIEPLKQLSQILRATPAQIELAWIMLRGFVVTTKSSLYERISENFDAQNLVEALSRHKTLLSAIEACEDMFPFGVTPVAEESRKHGSSLKWSVSEQAQAQFTEMHPG